MQTKLSQHCNTSCRASCVKSLMYMTDVLVGESVINQRRQNIGEKWTMRVTGKHALSLVPHTRHTYNTMWHWISFRSTHRTASIGELFYKRSHKNETEKLISGEKSCQAVKDASQQFMVEYDLRDCKSKGMDTSSTIISTRWHHICQQSYSNSNPAGTDIRGRVHSVSGKLSLLPSVSTSQCGDAPRLGSKGRMAHSIYG